MNKLFKYYIIFTNYPIKILIKLLKSKKINFNINIK